jgi:hypothetical protein
LKRRAFFISLVIWAALLSLTSAAQSAGDPYPWVPPDGITRPPPVRANPTPAPPVSDTVSTTFKIFLPLVMRNYLTFVGPNVPFGYGWHVYNRANHFTTSLGWIKINDNPPQQSIDFCGNNRWPKKVLLRLNFAEASRSASDTGDRTWEYVGYMQDNSPTGWCVDAVEVGNEPNLSGNGMYNGPVNPALYADQLCASYTAVKGLNPNLIVVSAGLAPTAPHPDPTFVMDEEAFLRAMLDRIRDTHNGDAGACFDVLGYHNYGFRTGYSTDPNNVDLCPSGMCYRGVERIQAILWNEYNVYKKIWTTEMGWLRDFYAGGCGGAWWEPYFRGFQNSDQGQADQLVNAFQYARANWGWSGAMFVFNFDFNERPAWVTNPCYDEQGWFAVKNKPAHTALETMPKP